MNSNYRSIIIHLSLCERETAWRKWETLVVT